MKTNTDDYVIWKLPKDAASTIIETLELDTQSSSFTPEVRKQIGEAMDSINDVSQLLPACQKMLEAYAPDADRTAARTGEHSLHCAVIAARAAVRKANTVTQ